MADDTTQPIDDPAADRRIARMADWGRHAAAGAARDSLRRTTSSCPRHRHGAGLSPFVAVAYVTAERLGDVLPAGALRATRLNKPLLFRHQISLLMAFLAALVARELFFVLRRSGANRRHALGWALMFACTPPVLSHAFLFFTEVPTALITLFVFRRLSPQPLPSPVAAAVLGALPGYLWLVHARNIGIVAAFVLIVVLLGVRRVVPTRFVMCFVSAVMLGAFARCAVTYALWGGWLTTPHAAVHVNGNVRDTIFEVLIRATGLLFDREHGLLAYAAALAGARCADRDRLLFDSGAAAADQRARLARRLVSSSPVSRADRAPTLAGRPYDRGGDFASRTRRGDSAHDRTDRH
jgi:hypothetical protein